MGNHAGYVFVRAGGAKEAIDDYVPPFLRERAVAYRLSTISGRDLRRMREERGESVRARVEGSMT